MVTIYILGLQHGKYYVGKTRNKLPEERILDHFVGDGSGSAWTIEHLPVRIVSWTHTSIAATLMKTSSRRSIWLSMVSITFAEGHTARWTLMQPQSNCCSVRFEGREMFACGVDARDTLWHSALSKLTWMARRS